MFVLVQFPNVLYSAGAGADGGATNTGNADNDIIDSAAAGSSSIAGHLGTAETAWRRWSWRRATGTFAPGVDAAWAGADGSSGGCGVRG